ncbi:MAG: MFS transporter, partial [Chloroflexi bacterium]|nr:MFS transporter [Chloroflexota bacterium]
HERRARHPVLDLRLFRGNRTFTLSSLAALIDYSATSSVTFLMSLYLQVVRGMSPRLAGTVLVAQPVLMAIFSPLAGRLSDRIEPRLVASAGMSTMVVGLTLLALLQPETELAYVLVCLVLLGLGFAFFSSPNVSAIMGSVARQYYGVASGMVGTMRLFGQMLSMGIAMLLFSIYIGQVQITPANYDRFMLSARTNFAISALLCVLGVLASASRGRLRDAETAAAH